MPPHELPQRIAILHGTGQGRDGPARPEGVPLKPWRKLSQAFGSTLRQHHGATSALSRYTQLQLRRRRQAREARHTGDRRHPPCSGG